MSASKLSDTLFSGNNAGFIELQYARYLENPASVDISWRQFFDSLEEGAARAAALGPSWQRADWPPVAAQRARAEAPKAPASGEEVRRATLDSIRALMMIRAFRVRGHLLAHLDPLGLEERPEHPELLPESYGFEDGDLDRPIFLDHVLGLEMGTVNEIMAILQRTYCGPVGVEFMHISVPEEKAWIQEKIEGRDKDIHFTPEGKKAILQKLIEAEQFEKYLARKYVGTKRFGLDGGEAMIPALEGVIKTGGQLGVEEIVLGMAHRGRLNVLANVMKKPFKAIFHEFHGGASKPDDVQGSGDVKYHLGTSTTREFDGKKVYLSLAANPSHLEAVDPVVLGRTRAKQTIGKDFEDKRVMPLIIHGDAAFAGQGIVAECFMLSGLRGYRTGGTLHFIINNQIGFTTNPHHSRSSPYPSDSAKMVQAPIFHVNGDDPEAVVFVAKLATEFRQTFKKDVVIDMVCYRRFGHNESDEPAFTQPKMYARIRSHPGQAALYAEKLTAEGTINKDDPKAFEESYVEVLDRELKAADKYKPEADQFKGRWKGLNKPADAIGFTKTGITKKDFEAFGKTLTTVPKEFNIHRTLLRFLKNRAAMFETGQGLDWATAEALSMAATLSDGFSVRLTGQDTIRGTFSQRHADFIDQETEERFNPLAAIETKGQLEIIDSPLSETGVLGFEYGFSQADPNTLVMWEAQFGDFVNVAQVVIDQFISSAEAKWLRSSGLVMLLPHGFEGQGPEHSSARPERFLQMCAENNMQIANCTTPANYFHILRRQMVRPFRKPLVIMTPKSLLRHKKAVSTAEEFLTGTGFMHILKDDAERLENPDFKLAADKGIKRAVLCTGKVYYDLLAERDKRKVKDTYILRVEQLYPFPKDMIAKELRRFPGLASLVWCQEEPKNMGAWSFIAPLLEDVLAEVKTKGVTRRPRYAGRQPSASPATGQASAHEKQQAALVDAALTL